MIGVGTRWSDFTTASRTAFQHPGVRFVSLNVASLDAAEHAGVLLLADAREGLEAMTGALTGYTTSVPWDIAGGDAEVDRASHPGHGPLPAQTEVLGALNEGIAPRDVVVQAAGSMPDGLQMLRRARDRKQYHVEYAYSCMGYETAGALPESLGSQRFGTSYRCRGESGRPDGDVLPVDPAADVASLGADVIRVRTTDELKDAIEHYRAAVRTTAIHVETDPLAPVPGSQGRWDVPVSEVAQLESTRHARTTYQAHEREQRPPIAPIDTGDHP